MLDQGGALKGRINSWPKTMDNYPESSAKNSSYFDPAVMLHHTKAHIFCEIGLFDITCPAPNLYATMNSVKTEKVVVPWQRQHHANAFNKKEHKVISDKREEFFKYELTR